MRPRFSSAREVLLPALDALASSVVAVLLLFAVVTVAIVLLLGCLTLWTHLAHDHGLLLTSVRLGSDFGPQ